jgi:hypothetical protein
MWEMLGRLTSRRSPTQLSEAEWALVEPHLLGPRGRPGGPAPLRGASAWMPASTGRAPDGPGTSSGSHTAGSITGTRGLVVRGAKSP